MNKLREKFDAIIPMYVACEDSDVDQLEQITDDFSVKFLEWKDKLQLESKIGLMDRGFSVYMENGKKPVSVTTTELQQYFKDNIYE